MPHVSLLVLDRRSSWMALRLRGKHCSLRKEPLGPSCLSLQTPTPTCWVIRTNDRKSSTWSNSRRRTWFSSRSGLPRLCLKQSFVSLCVDYSKLCCTDEFLVCFYRKWLSWGHRQWSRRGTWSSSSLIRPRAGLTPAKPSNTNIKRTSSLCCLLDRDRSYKLVTILTNQQFLEYMMYCHIAIPTLCLLG